MSQLIEFSTVKLSQVNIHFAYAGQSIIRQSGDGQSRDYKKPLLLCLHGFPEFWQTWQSVLEQCSDEFFVVAPDLRGYNFSDKPSEIESYRLPHLVQDVLELSQALGYDKFYLVGHDWGGIIAWTMASLRPDVLHKLCILNSPHPRVFQKVLGQSPYQVAASEYINKFLDNSAANKLSQNEFELLWRFGFSDLIKKKIFTEVQRKTYREAWAREGAIDAMLAYYRANAFKVPKVDDLPIDYAVNHLQANQVTIPTQVIWGLDDTAITAECLAGLSDYVPDLRIRTLENTGHWIMHEQSDRVVKLMQDFFTSGLL